MSEFDEIKMMRYVELCERRVREGVNGRGWVIWVDDESATMRHVEMIQAEVRRRLPRERITIQLGNPQRPGDSTKIQYGGPAFMSFGPVRE